MYSVHCTEYIRNSEELFYFCIKILPSSLNNTCQDFILCLSEPQNISKISCDVWLLAGITSSGLHLFCHNHFLRIGQQVHLHSGRICLSKRGSVSIPMVSYFFYKSIYIQFRFYSHCYHFEFSFGTFIFFGQFSLKIILYKLSHGFITGRQGDNTATCFAVCTWTE